MKIVGLLNIPNWFKPAMYGNFDQASDTASTGKLIGLCQLPASLSWEEIKAKGVTHLYNRPGANVSEIYETFKYYNPVTSAQAAYNAGKGIVQNGQFNAQSIFTEELSEDGTLDFNNYWNLAPHWYKGMTDQMGNGGVKNRIYGSYTGGQHDVSIQQFHTDFGGTINPLFYAFRDGLDDQSNARKLYNLNNGELNTFPFFNNVDGIVMSEIIGLLTNTYSGWLPGDNAAAFCYSKFYEIQKKFAAGIRNTIIFTWTGSESANAHIESPQAGSGWRVMRDDVQNGAYWRAIAHHNNNPMIALWNAVLGVFRADGIVYWDSRRESFVKTPQNLEAPGYFPQYWVSSSAPEPARQNPPKMSSFPWWQQDYAIIANQWFAHCKTVLDAGGEYRYFGYTSSVNGVVNVNTDKTNDTRLFTESAKPYGQNTVLHLANGKKGICFGAYIGNSFFAVYFNPYLSANQSETISVNVNGVSRNIGTIKGKTVAVYRS